MSDQDHLPRRLWWLLAGLTFAWGFNWTAMKVALADVPPWTFRTLCLGFGSAQADSAWRLHRGNGRALRCWLSSPSPAGTC